MKCPTDDTTLVMSERSGIEIDYCPECRGVWLDRGELDKIIDRAESAAPLPAASAPAAPAPPAAPYPPQQPVYEDRRDGRYDRGYDPRYGQQPYRKKKENWLSELFD